MINLEKLGLSSEEVLQRSQMKTILGGDTTMWSCSCNGGAYFLVMDDSDDPTPVCGPGNNAHCIGLN